MVNINDLLRQHVTLEVECLDRLYLNGYIPQLQVGGQLVSFLRQQRGQPIPSPALLGQITQDFKSRVESFAAQHGLPIIHFERGQRKDDIAAQHRPPASGLPSGVYLMGVAQEKAHAFRATKRREPGSGQVGFDYERTTVYVNHYYFYFCDQEFGPGFLKIGSYAPFPIKVCLNGHEWVKRQLQKAGIAFEPLDNGFLSCAQPQRLQELCDRLGPEQIQAGFDRWLEALPLPLTPADRAAGYDYRLSIWQMEVSRTQVFDQPRRGRQFFEEVIRENVDLGRPDRVALVFDRKVVKSTPGHCRTRIIQQGVHPSLHIEYKSCHVKQYFKENRALRTETTINNPQDFNFGKDLSHLRPLQGIGRRINRRLLEVQRLSQACTLSQETVEQITQPTVTADGQRAPGLRFGNPRVMALLGALTLFCHLPQGLCNATLRPHVAALLGPDIAYGPQQMSYDLRRLRRKGLVQALAGTHRYRITPYGRKVSLFFTKLEARVLRPAFASFDAAEPLPRPLASALRAVDAACDDLIAQAQLAYATSI